MKLLGIRFCSVSEDASEFAKFLESGLGLEKTTMDAGEGLDDSDFQGAVFPAGDSWIEVWPEVEGMPAGVMLQLVVDDADAFAAHARASGFRAQGPTDAHGERIYFIQAPGGLAMSFQSKM